LQKESITCGEYPARFTSGKTALTATRTLTVHVQAVEDNIWRLLQTTTILNKANNLEDFMAFELFLLSCAACCHDFDKALKSALPEGFKHGEGSGDFVEKKYGSTWSDPPTGQCNQQRDQHP